MNDYQAFLKKHAKIVTTLKKQFGFVDCSAVVFLREKGRCFYCGQDVYSSRANYALFCVDHVLPQAKFQSLKGDRDNLVLCCCTCNKVKRDHVFEHANFVDPAGALKKHRDKYLNHVKRKMQELTKTERHVREVDEVDEDSTVVTNVKPNTSLNRTPPTSVYHSRSAGADQFKRYDSRTLMPKSTGAPVNTIL